jgi:hypothetical protein
MVKSCSGIANSLRNRRFITMHMVMFSQLEHFGERWLSAGTQGLGHRRRARYCLNKETLGKRALSRICQNEALFVTSLSLESVRCCTNSGKLLNCHSGLVSSGSNGKETIDLPGMQKSNGRSRSPGDKLKHFELAMSQCFSAKFFPAISAMLWPIASDAVAPGDGALRIWIARGLCLMTKSSTSAPLAETA